MKIQAIKAICKGRKTALLQNIGGVQWISDGSAAYPLNGMPRFDRESILRFFDIPEDKWDKFYCKDDVGLDMNFDTLDVIDNEEEAEMWRVKLVFNGMTLVPLKTSAGPVFIDARYLKPFDGEAEPPGLFVRLNSSGHIYIAVKSGLLLSGMIMPVIFHENGEQLRLELREIFMGMEAEVK